MINSSNDIVHKLIYEMIKCHSFVCFQLCIHNNPHTHIEVHSANITSLGSTGKRFVAIALLKIIYFILKIENEKTPII